MSIFSRCFGFIKIPDISLEDLRFCVNTSRALAARSRAERLRVGAVVWHPKRRTIIGIGYNGTAAGASNVMEMDGMTLPEVIHAERNAIMKCSSWDLWGSIIVITHSPCVSCARMMRDAGVRSVYYLENYRDPAGIEVLRAAGIRVQRVLT